MKAMTNWLAGFAGAVLLAGNVAGAPILLDLQDGGVYPYDGWTDGQVDGYPQPTGLTVDEATLGGQNAIRMEGTAADDTVRAVLVSTPSFGSDMHDYTPLPGFAPPGNYQVTQLQFAFYHTADGPPSQIGFFVQTASSVWYYDIVPVDNAGNWETYSVDFSDGGWYGFTDSTWSTPVNFSSFSAALGNVTGLGGYVYFNPDEADPQTYGIYNYGLFGTEVDSMAIPEPETYVVLGMALLSMAFVFRKRITDSLAEAKAMIQT